MQKIKVVTDNQLYWQLRREHPKNGCIKTDNPEVPTFMWGGIDYICVTENRVTVYDRGIPKGIQKKYGYKPGEYNNSVSILRGDDEDKKDGVKILNLTPHDVIIMNKSERVIRVFKPRGLARLKSRTISKGKLDRVPITRTVLGETEGVPEFQEGTYYIVSKLVRDALPNRKDLLVPSQIVKDEEEQIIGCLSLDA